MNSNGWKRNESMGSNGKRQWEEWIDRFSFKLERFAYKFFVRPTIGIGQLILIVMLLVGCFAPIAYLGWGALFWLKNGIWLTYNLCVDLNIMCGNSDALGLNKITRFLAENVFLSVCLGSVIWSFVMLRVFGALESLSSNGDDRYLKK
jgi:hypothetical protein